MMSGPVNPSEKHTPGPAARGAPEIAAQVVGATSAGVPLALGLRSLAEETPGRRLSARLTRLAQRLEQGQPLDRSLRDPRDGLPDYVVGLIQAAVRCGDTGEAFVDLVDHRRDLQRMWHSVRSELSYSLILVGLSLSVTVWVALGLVGPFVGLFREFDLELPAVSRALIWMTEVGVWWLLGLLVGAIAVTALFRLLCGAARWRRLLASVPLIGPLWGWSAAAEWCWLLAILTARRIPLPEALQLAADGMHDAGFRETSRLFSGWTEEGRTLAEAMGKSPRLPATLNPVIRWGERCGCLPEAFRVGGDMFFERVLARADLVNTVVPPVVFIAVATLVLTVIFGLYAPLVSLIQGLS
jgi:type II secretory pathway component PulF